jgi:plastocyanin
MIIRSGIAVAAVVGTGIGAALAFSSSPVLHAAPAAAHAHKTVAIKEVNGKYQFATKTLTVKIGTTVTWKNGTDAPHTVTGNGSWKFASKTFSQGQSVKFTFSKAGTYQYMCAIHPYMKAKVVVKK